MQRVVRRFPQGLKHQPSRVEHNYPLTHGGRVGKELGSHGGHEARALDRDGSAALARCVAPEGGPPDLEGAVERVVEDPAAALRGRRVVLEERVGNGELRAGAGAGGGWRVSRSGRTSFVRRGAGWGEGLGSRGGCEPRCSARRAPRRRRARWRRSPRPCSSGPRCCCGRTTAGPRTTGTPRRLRNGERQGRQKQGVESLSVAQMLPPWSPAKPLLWSAYPAGTSPRRTPPCCGGTGSPSRRRRSGTRRPRRRTPRLSRSRRRSGSPCTRGRRCLRSGRAVTPGEEPLRESVLGLRRAQDRGCRRSPRQRAQRKQPPTELGPVAVELTQRESVNEALAQ